MAEHDWTLAKGVRRAVVHLLIWSLVCLVTWTVVVLITTPLLDAIPGQGTGISRARSIVSTVIALPMSWFCKRRLYEKLSEAAGFNSIQLLGMAYVCLWLIAFTGVMFAERINPPAVNNGMLWLRLGLAGSVWMAWEMFADR
jgi:hypothetical protein